MIKAQTLKGFRDFLPSDAIKRKYIISTISRIFEQYGFDPLETPALEYAETLMGKYGSEADKLLYLFKDNGKRNVGLRYDQTVPFSRVIAQYPDLPMPFKRYQIQPVWRAENTQKGRYREFLQCDIDTVGSESPQADAEIIGCMLAVTKAFNLSGAVVHLNDRTIFDNLGLKKEEIITIDKLDKIGADAVIAELQRLGRENAQELFTTLKQSTPTPRLEAIMDALKTDYRDMVDFCFDPFLARGLDYYTSTIYELKIPAYPTGSIAGGGRYDNLIGTFTGRPIPAVGVAFGFDRLLEVLTELQVVPETKTATKILVTCFSPKFIQSTQAMTAQLRHAGINTESYVDTQAKLEKQLKYADKKGIPYVIIQGPEEKEKQVVKLKNMQTKTQDEVTIHKIIELLTIDS